MKIIAFFISLSFFTQGFSQQEIYLDEKMKSIDSIQFYNKCQSHILKCLEYKTDSLIVNKILYKYSFGKISSIESNQLRKLLVKDSKTNVDSNSVLLIKYYDSLFNFKTTYRNHIKHIESHKVIKSIKVNNKPVRVYVQHNKYNKKKYNKNKKKWIKSKNKCIDKFEASNLNIFYIYKYEQDVISSYTDFKWIKDRGVFKNMFFNIMYESNLVIIKPNGEYFLSGSHLSNKHVKLLIKNSDWSKYKLDFTNSIKTHKKNGKGFFSKDSGFHKTHCF